MLPGDGTYRAINYTSLSGAGTFAVANAASYRTAPSTSVVGGAVDVTISGTKDLTWNGTAGLTTWDVNTTTNWLDSVSAAEKFYFGDGVAFTEDANASGLAVAVNSGVTPRSVTVTSNTKNFVFTSAGSGISGGTSLSKTGSSTLTLNGNNSYGGYTVVNGGNLIAASPASIGSGAIGNLIAIDNNAKLTLTTTASTDLGINRDLYIGSGGGAFAHNSTTGNTAITISGNIVGTGALAIRTEGTSGTVSQTTNYNLTGADNSGFSGPITVTSFGNILSTLTIGSQASLPAASSITLNHPNASITNGNSTTLSLIGNITIPNTTTLNFTSSQPTSAISLRSGLTTTGTSTVVLNSPITVSGTSVVQFTAAAASSVSYNGAITETTPGAFVEAAPAFSNIIFFRGSGTHNINNTITLPSAGSTIGITDGATVILNVAGNSFRSANSLFGTLRLGISNALPSTARLVIGQGGDQACTFDMNGFDQTVAGLEWQAPTGNLLTKGISNSHPTATSTFTLNQTTAPIANFNGTISGRINFVKNGAATTTLVAPASTFTGNVTVNGGTLAVTGIGAASGANGTLGAANVVGKTITVNPTATLSFGSNNIFGNGVANSNLPAVVIEGGALASTRYNVLGDLTLNGGTLSQSSTDSGNFEGYQFRGNVTVGGSAASTISTGNSKANHLGANTTFTIADATGSSASDLLVSAPLRNQSGDFATATGGLTKLGNGTLELSAVNTYTGATNINAGTLALAVTGSISGSLTTVNSGGTLAGTGTAGAVNVASGGTVAPGFSAGTLTTGALTFASGSTAAIELYTTSSYDIVSTTGNVDLGGATLSLLIQPAFYASVDPAFNSPNNQMWILNNSGTNSLTGTFAGPSSFVQDGYQFEIYYNADFGTNSLTGGNDVLLVVPEPGSVASLLGGLGLLLGLQRRRRRS